MAAWVWVLIAIAIAVVIAIVLLTLAARKRRSEMLRQRFGPEYDRAVEAHEDRRVAEADLRYRERRRAQFDVKPLPEAACLRFAGEWREVQERFVDDPIQAVAAADALIGQVMEARGYPVRDFERQAELLSVDYPTVVGNYRAAHTVWQRSEAGQASTEDLREALLRYRSLFDELLQPAGTETPTSAGPAEGAATPTPDAAVPQAQDEACSASVPADGAGSASVPADGAGSASVPADGAGSASVPQDEAGSASVPQDEAGAATGDGVYEDQPVHRGGR